MARMQGESSRKGQGKATSECLKLVNGITDKDKVAEDIANP